MGTNYSLPRKIRRFSSDTRPKQALGYTEEGDLSVKTSGSALLKRKRLGAFCAVDVFPTGA